MTSTTTMKYKLLYFVILFTNLSLHKLTANPLSAHLIISPSSDVINQQTKQLFVLSCKVNVDQQDLFITLRWFDPRGEEITPVYTRDKNPDITTQEYLLAGLLYLQFKKPRTDDSGTYTCKGFTPNFEPIQAQTQVQFYDETIDGGDDDALCPRNREEASSRGRQCLRKCKSDADCISSKKRCLCDGLCGWSCVRPDLNCDEIPPIENGNFKMNGNFFGARVTYNCNEGFIMSGTKEKVCQGDSSWSDTSPQCKKQASCGPPITLLHAQNTAPSNQTEFPVDSQVTYSCFIGYQSKGSNIAKCLYMNGTTQWFGPELECIPKSCGHPGEVEYAMREGNEFTFTSKVSYFCKPGYEIIGRTNRYCQSDGQWSHVKPSCRPVHCPIPEDPLNGRALYTSVNFGSTVRYECRHQFTLVGNTTRVCGTRKEWEGEIPVCKEIDCGSPGVFPNGYYELERTVQGSVVHFRCYDGMIFVGENSSICLTNGSWSNPIPSCLAPCVVPDIDNGKVSQITPGARLNHGQMIKIDCKHQYEQHNNVSISVCNNGSWTQLPKCVPARCTKLPEQPKNGMVIVPKTNHGIKALYRCKDGFKLEGNNITECVFGNWTSPTPKCMEVYCPFPGFLENGKVLLIGHMGMYDYRPYVKTVKNNKQILYECEKGYTIVSGPPGATCVDGQWSPQEFPKCIKFSHPKFSRVSRSIKTRNKRKINRKAIKNASSYKNYQYYDDNSKMIKEIKRKSRGRRHNNNIKPDCKELKETNWKTFVIIKYGIENHIYSHGTVIKLKCSKGYHSNIGSAKAKCAKGIWKPKQPECLYDSCLVPYAENGYFIHSKNSKVSMGQKINHSESIHMKCSSGYQSQGTQTIKCLYGEWISQSSPLKHLLTSKQANSSSTFKNVMPKCITSPCSLPIIRNGYYSGGYRPGLTVAHGSVIEYQCKINFVKGNSVAPRCFEGNIMPEPPHCIEQDLISSKMVNEETFSKEILSEEIVNNNFSSNKKLWCQPPERLKNVLKYHQEDENESLIGIIQMNHEFEKTNQTESTATKSTQYIINYLNGTTTDSPENNYYNFTKIYQETIKTFELTEEDQNNYIYSAGTEMLFKCVPDLHGQKTTWKITCEAGGWIGRAFRCDEDDFANNKSCYYKHPKENVLVFLEDKMINFNEEKEFPSKTELTFRCADIGKFSLIGSVKRKCVAGQWDGDDPFCYGLSQQHDYAIEMPPTILFRHQLGPIAQSADGKLIVYPGTILHLECLWLRKYGKPTWKWTHQSSYNQNWTTEPDRDSQLEYRMSIIHAKKEDSGVYTCATPNKRQHSVEIVVKAVHCPFMNHSVNESNGLRMTNINNKMNAKITFSCENGMKLNGTDEIVCLPSGQWSSKIPNCIINECPDISVLIQNENVSTNNSLLKATSNGRLFGDSVSFMCPLGYGLIGNEEITCLETGKWSDAIPSCQEVFCEAPSIPPNGYLQGEYQNIFRGGDIVQFGCDSGYMIQGNPIIICQENQRWSGPPPKCISACTYPGTMHGGTISLVKFFYSINETVTFDCADGYEIKGTKTLKCLESGRWSSSVPECQFNNKNIKV